MIRCIVFDLGGVLIHDKTDQILENVSKKLGIKSQSLSKRLLPLLKRVQTGKMTVLEMYDKISKESGLAEELYRIHLSTYSNEKDFRMFELLDKIRSESLYKVGCLTNTEPEVADLNRDLFDIFDFQVVSCDEGFRKPERKIYDLMIKKSKHKASEILYIDDAKENVSAAEKMGIESIQFRSYKQLVSDFGRIDLL